MGEGVFESIITKKAISVLPDFKGKDTPHRMLDLRCSFGEESLKEFLKEVRPSQLQFKGNDRVDFHLSFVSSLITN